MTVIGGVAALLAYAFLASYFVLKIYQWKTDPVYTQSIMKSFRQDNRREIIPATTFIPALRFRNFEGRKNDNVQVSFKQYFNSTNERTIEAVKCSKLLGERFDELSSQYEKPRTEELSKAKHVM